MYIYEDSPCGVVANVLDWDILVSKFELRLHHNVHFRTDTHKKKGIITRIFLPNHGLNSWLVCWLVRF